MWKAGTTIFDGLVLDVTEPKFSYPEGFNWTLREQVENRGYLFEEHTIETEDGYLLKAFRVPARINGNEDVKRQPVILQHGLIDDGGTWFYNNAQLDLSLELVDEGYDIWVTNSRGTVYSNQHKLHTVKDKAFWDFSLHDMGKYDVPANVKYILNLTGFEQIIYFGHSQGTTQWFIGNVLDESISKYFKAFIGLAPVGYTHN